MAFFIAAEAIETCKKMGREFTGRHLYKQCLFLEKCSISFHSSQKVEGKSIRISAITKNSPTQ
jgi:hypothetical protein